MAKKTKKSTAKKIDKRTTPKFIAHLRKLAKQRHLEAVARKKAKVMEAEVASEGRAAKIQKKAKSLVELAKQSTKKAA